MRRGRSRDPAQDLWFPYWFSLDAIPASVTSTCPPDRREGAQFAESRRLDPGSQPARDPGRRRQLLDPHRRDSSAPGSVLLCAYTDDGAATTLAAASLTLNIQAKPSTKGTGSGAAGIPAEARRGIRSCVALLGPKDAHSCVRSAVRRANAACRRLHSPNGRAACLSAVGQDRAEVPMSRGWPTGLSAPEARRAIGLERSSARARPSGRTRSQQLRDVCVRRAESATTRPLAGTEVGGKFGVLRIFRTRRLHLHGALRPVWSEGVLCRRRSLTRPLSYALLFYV